MRIPFYASIGNNDARHAGWSGLGLAIDEAMLACCRVDLNG
jgi:hypothetical protein